jgi:hypothetical protein
VDWCFDHAELPWYNQLANAIWSQAHEKIMLHDALGLGLWQEGAGIITAQAIGHIGGLSQVIRAEVPKLKNSASSANLPSCSDKSGVPKMFQNTKHGTCGAAPELSSNSSLHAGAFRWLPRESFPRI